MEQLLPFKVEHKTYVIRIICPYRSARPRYKIIYRTLEPDAWQTSAMLRQWCKRQCRLDSRLGGKDWNIFWLPRILELALEPRTLSWLPFLVYQNRNYSKNVKKSYVSKISLLGLDSVITNLAQRGIQVAAYINPHLNVEGDVFLEADKLGYLLKNSFNETYRQDFGGFLAGTIDFSNPLAKQWYAGTIIVIYIE